MRRNGLALLVLSLALFLGPSNADARDFGLGVIFGEPGTGLSLKLWPTRVMAIDGALAWSSGDGHTYFRFHADLLFHTGLRFGPETGTLAFYYGLGARYQQRGEQVGLRLPLGLSYLFSGLPLEVFIEFIPTLDLTPDTEFLPKLAGGLRFYLF